MKSLFYLIPILMVISCNSNSAEKNSPSENTQMNNLAAQSENTQNTRPDNRSWRLVWLSEKSITDSINGRIPYISFNPIDSSLNGTMGCNRIGARYVINDNAISFSKGFATKMFCKDLWAEDTFLKNMDSINRFTLVSDSLKLMQGEKTIAILTPYNVPAESK